MTHTLLLADDSITIQRVIELTFSGEDIEVISVGDGERAVECLQLDRPDIVLADISMPKRNGYDVAAYIRSQPALAQMPVLLLAGAFETVDQARAEQVGCDGVLVKPFEPRQVVARVRELLARADATKRRASRAAASSPPSVTEEPLAGPGVNGDGQAESQAASVPMVLPVDPSREPQEAAADVLIEHVADTRPASVPEPAIGQWFASELDADVPAAVAAAMEASVPQMFVDAPAAVPVSGASAPLVADPPSEAALAAPADAFEDYFGRLGSAVEAFGASGRGSHESKGVGTTFDDPWTYGEVPTVSRVLEPSTPTWPGAGRSAAVSGGERPAMARDAFAPERLTDDEPVAARDSSAASSFIADAFHALLESEQGRPRTVEPKPTPVVSPVASGQDISEELVERVTQRVIERLVPHAARDMVAGIVSDVAERLVREEIARSRTRAEGRQ